MTQADRIHLRDYVIAADIGAFQSERGSAQRLRFEVQVDLAAPISGAEDQVDRILSYDVLTDAIANALADQRYNLLETLAERIAAEILTHPAADRVWLRVEKLDRGPGALGITISRDAAQITAAQPAANGPAPVLLLGSVQHAPKAPRIIIPDAPGLPLPEGGNDRMIALLAIDQAAWALAARLGLDVADSRTELDWAAANGISAVWAPTRMVADVTDLPPLAADLALWLARRLSASAMECALPGDAELPQAPADLPIAITRTAI